MIKTIIFSSIAIILLMVWMNSASYNKKSDQVEKIEKD